MTARNPSLILLARRGFLCLSLYIYWLIPGFLGQQHHHQPLFLFRRLYKCIGEKGYTSGILTLSELLFFFYFCSFFLFFFSKTKNKTKILNKESLIYQLRDDWRLGPVVSFSVSVNTRTLSPSVCVPQRGAKAMWLCVPMAFDGSVDECR